MDYLGMLKESWMVTWHNKKLWILGLFGGSTAGLMSGSSGGGGGAGDQGVTYHVSSEREVEQAIDWMQQYHLLPQSVDSVPDLIGFALLIVAILLVIAVIFWIIGIAARGGLVHLSREALDGREVRLSDGWRVGFRYWGRVFLVRFVLALPVIALLGIAAVFGVIAVAPIIATGGDPAAIPMLGLLVIVPVLLLGVAIAGVVIHMLSEVAVRYAVLEDARVTESISTAWAKLWGRAGVFTTWLLTLLVSWGVGIAALLGVVPFGIILVGAIIAQSIPGVVVAGLLVLAWILIAASISGTLLSTVWTTLHLRYLTGEPDA